MVKQIKLDYKLNDLEPVIDKATMDLHYNKHHAAYTKNTNNILDNLDIKSEDHIEIFKLSKGNQSLINNGGGWWNHNFYFESLSKPDTSKISKKFMDIITKNFGSYDKFVELFSNTAATRFGSGWAWLGKKNDGSLEIYSTSNQDNCFMDHIKNKSNPILCIDVWEHAYYLKYKNNRAEYIKNYFRVIDWNKVELRYNEN